MDLAVRHLRLVTAIVEEGSVTRAAERLYLTQPAVSHQLADIEERLGARLFHRINKRMVLTPAGERLLRAAGPLLEQLERTEEEIRQIGRGRQGILRVATQCYTCYHWLPALLHQYGRKYPEIELDIVAEATRDPYPALLRGSLDVAIVQRRIPDRNLHFERLFEDELLVLAGSRHRLATRPYIRPRDLATEHLIIHFGFEESTVARKVLIPHEITPRKVSELQLTEAVIAMVRAGMGVTVMARWAALPYLEAGGLTALPLTRKGVYRQWRAATLTSNRKAPHIRDFIRLLSESAALDIQSSQQRPLLCAVRGT